VRHAGVSAAVSAALPIATADHGVLWTAPSILVAAMLIAWAAESAHSSIAQGFALAISPGCRPCPFAVEACWRKSTGIAASGHLTGALRLPSLGWR